MIKTKNCEKILFKGFPPHPSSEPCGHLPGKRENKENLLRERRRGGGDATDGEGGGVTAERERRERKRNRETTELV